MSADESGNATPVAAINGEPRPETNLSATPGKRKRSVQDEKVGPESSSSAPHEKTNLHENLRNLVQLLVKHDSNNLKLLSCPFPTSTTKPRAKRAKVSSDHETSNVQSRVESGRYNTLQEFLADIERASSAVIERNQNQSNGSTNPDGTPLNEVVNRIAAFKKHMNSLIGQSFVNQPDVKAESPDDDSDDQILSTVAHVGAREDKQALTIFGNASTPAHPKQLFSSLQKSVKMPLPSSDVDEEKFVEVQGELREGGLPNGISTTKVVPYNLDSASQPRKRTFGEVFAPRTGLPQLERPRRRSNRSTSVSWIDPFDAMFNPRSLYDERSSYALAPLPSGHWLRYGGVTSSPSFWARADKQNPGGYSGPKGGDPAILTDDESSLLQGVYSSFAPSYDSSESVVQHDAKNMVWWEKRGSKRLRALLSLQNEDEEVTTAQPGSIGDLDESALEEMVKSFNPEDFAVNLSEQNESSNVDPESREVEELLAEISDLLDTLSSYQKIRHLTLPSSEGDNTNTESKETPVPEVHDPEAPSDAERDVYETLKASLLAIIGNLPPYAIAKLDGDQLAELNISQKILVENSDYSGTMERDDFTLHQERNAAMAAAAANANRTSTPSAPRPGGYQGPPPVYNQRAMSANAQVPPRPNFPTPQHGRQPSNAGNFTPGYAGGRPPSTPSQRPVYNTPQQYAQGNQHYGQANNAPQFQRPPSNGFAQSPQPYTPRPGQPAGYNATPQTRTPYANAGAVPTPPYARGSPSQGHYSNSAAAAIHARSAAEQAARTQYAAAQQRQSSSTPQPHGFEARQSQEGSLTPGSKQNGTPVPS
ncbi:hypothetical protein N7532_004191 [Penicillium argentinense]|uniref:Uncharacterized protein n=1 Tax=Penicillium argentinense TaxID=1131581 RepID=A0A9W9FNW3_9EURO|nr:uncharacterized protein N7532_004191 [Penicillium argentinense]KAJ5103662.1 hypothetical protein N7532_004191 [Penicillium argentinense]